MPSFDVVSEIDMQEVDNAVNSTEREISNRYDFKAIKWSIELDKKEKTITIIAESEYCLEQIKLSLKGSFVKRKIDPISLDFQKEEKASGNSIRQLAKLKEGIDQENAKQITKFFKQSKSKLQASINGDKVRVAGKSRDDLQQAIQQIKDLKLNLPLQFNNFRD